MDEPSQAVTAETETETETETDADETEPFDFPVRGASVRIPKPIEADWVFFHEDQSETETWQHRRHNVMIVAAEPGTPLYEFGEPGNELPDQHAYIVLIVCQGAPLPAAEVRLPRYRYYPAAMVGARKWIKTNPHRLEPRPIAPPIEPDQPPPG